MRCPEGLQLESRISVKKRSRVLQEGMGVWGDFQVEDFSKKGNCASASFAPNLT